MNKKFSEHTSICIPICKVPKRFDITIRICSPNGKSLSCNITDSIKHCGIYDRIEFIEYEPRITTIFLLLRKVIIDMFLMMRGK